MSLFSDDEEMNPRKENELDNQSDVSNRDEYDENDYYNDNNKEYKEADYKPSIPPPKYILDINKKAFDKNMRRQFNETFMNFDEKFQKINNGDSLEEEFPNQTTDDICNNYKIIFKENIDYTSNRFDMYSKNHLRNTLSQEINNLDWKNKEADIQVAKKETNAYEDINEKFFEKKTSLQLANINYLFEKELIKYDSIYEGFPVLTVGDNGGFADYILYLTIYKGYYEPTIFVIPEKYNDIKDIKYRKEIKDKAENYVHILNEFFEENKDIDENSQISVNFLNNIAKTISEKTQENMVNLYIARKVIKFNPDYSQEIKYKKFLLINTLLAFKCLSYGGNFIIKLYDTFTPFTIGLIYMIFKNFENVSIFKPVSTRQYSSSRYLIAEKYLKDTTESTNNSIKYLEDFLTKYIEFSNLNYDIQLFLYPSELRNNETFLKIIPEINNGITEKRIDAIKEIIKYMNNQKTKLYDNVSIRKFFLENWGVPVINTEEISKSQKYKQDKYNARNKLNKLYTEKDLFKIVDDVGKLDEAQERLLDSMFGDSKKKTKKNVKEKEKEKEKERTLEEKYEFLQKNVLGGRKNHSPRKKDPNVLSKKRERNSNNKNNDNKSSKKNTKYKIGKFDDNDDKKENSKDKNKDKDIIENDEDEDILFG